MVQLKVAVWFCSSQSKKEKETEKKKKKKKKDHWRGRYYAANCNVNLSRVNGAVWVTQGLHSGCSLCWPKGYTQDRELSPVISQPSNSCHRVEAGCEKQQRRPALIAHARGPQRPSTLRDRALKSSEARKDGAHPRALLPRDLCEYGTLSADFCASSHKDLMIVTGRLPC